MTKETATETTALISGEALELKEADFTKHIDKKQTERINRVLKGSLGVLAELCARVELTGPGGFVIVFLISMVPLILQYVLPKFITDEELLEFLRKLTVALQVAVNGAFSKSFYNSTRTVVSSNCALVSTHMPLAVTAASECAQMRQSKRDKEIAELRAQLARHEASTSTSGGLVEYQRIAI